MIKLDKQFTKFMDVFKKLHINIPFADTLEQMPSYVKFMKDILSKKRRLSYFETMNFTEECSAIFQRKLPQKLKDPSNFTIPCTIGNCIFERALCDLGASINLMSLSIFRQLGLGEARLTIVTLQLADRSLKHPRGGGGGGGGGGDRGCSGKGRHFYLLGRFHRSRHGRR